MSAPTLRSLARTLGVSRTTISEALRGSPRVRPATAEKIRAAAEAVGYHHNPLAGAIMSELRRSRGELFRGVLAILDYFAPDLGKKPDAASLLGLHFFLTSDAATYSLDETVGWLREAGFDAVRRIRLRRVPIQILLEAR